MQKDNARESARPNSTIKPNQRTTSQLAVFNNARFGELTIIADEDGSPWFIAREVAKALGHRNTSKTISDHVDDEDKGVTKRYTLGGEQTVTTINESGLYALIFSSRLEQAKAFKRWVTDEVLPSIRKHGGYTAGQEDLSPEELMAKALLVAKSTIQEKQQENDRLTSVVTELTQQFATGITIPEFCLQLNGVNVQQVQSALASKGILIREKHGFRPSSPYRNHYFESNPYEYRKGRYSYKPTVTQKGADLIYRMYQSSELPMRKDWDGSYTTHQLAKEPLTSHQS